jgi:hypothetical protein
LLTRDRAEETEEVENSDEQTAHGDGSEAVGESTTGSAASGSFGRVLRVEVPSEACQFANITPVKSPHASEIIG